MKSNSEILNLHNTMETYFNNSIPLHNEYIKAFDNIVIESNASQLSLNVISKNICNLDF